MAPNIFVRCLSKRTFTKSIFSLVRELNQLCLTRIKANLARTSLPAVAATAATNAVSQGFASGLDNAITDNTIHVGGAKAGRLLIKKMSPNRDRIVIAATTALAHYGAVYRMAVR